MQRSMISSTRRMRGSGEPPSNTAARHQVMDPRATAVRGRIVTAAKGQMDAFLNATFGWDFSGSACYAAGACGPIATPSAMYDNGEIRTRSGPMIDNRYVDGVSITVGCPASERGRRHVFTLAAGTATGIKPNAIGLPASDFPLNIPWNESFVRTYFDCWDDPTNPKMGCYLGNCGCQGGDAIRSQLGPSSDPWRHQVPDFVGEGAHT